MRRFGVVLLVFLAVVGAFGGARIIDVLDYNWFVLENTDPFTGASVIGVVGFASDYSFVSGASSQKPGMGLGIDYGSKVVVFHIVSQVIVPIGATDVEIRFDDEEPLQILMIGSSENAYRLSYFFLPSFAEYNEWLLKKLFTAKTLRVRVKGIFATQSLLFDLEMLQIGFKKHGLIKDLEKYSGVKISEYLEDSYF